MKKVLSVLLAMVLVLSATSALAAGTFKVGMECNYAPFNWTQAEPSDYAVEIEGGAGYADGYDVQIAKLLAEGLGLELVIVKTEWDGLPMSVMSGVTDAIIAGMSPTAERKVSIDFSDLYYTSDLVIVVKKEGAYKEAKTLADFSGAKITGQLNTFHYTVIEQIPGVQQMPAMDTFPAMTIALKAGAIDGYVAERPGAEADVLANPDLTYILFEEGFAASADDVSVAVGLKKNSEYLAKINEILAGLNEADRLQLMLDATLRQPLNQE